MPLNRLEQLLKLLQTEPKDSFLRYAIATEYVKLEEYQKATGYYELLLKEDENYIGTYYHFGKLLEQLKQKEKAIEIYRKGMLVARKIGNNHAFSELQSIYNQAVGLNYEEED